MKNIKEDIKNRIFKRIYLLCGTEEYLKKLYRNKLREAVLQDSDAMNLAEYDGNLLHLLQRWEDAVQRLRKAAGQCEKSVQHG